MNDREPYATLPNRVSAFLIFFFINFIVIFLFMYKLIRLIHNIH